MLNDFFSDGPLSECRPTLVQNINSLLAFARKAATPIVWVRQEFLADFSDSFLEMRNKQIAKTIAGTYGSQILDDLERRDEETVIVKKRYSAFFNTSLDQTIAKTNSDSLILCGVNTHACIRTTAIDAYQRDLNVIIVTDCVASYDSRHHEITLEYLGKGIAKLRTLADLIGGSNEA